MILPFTLLRRLECVLATSKTEVLAQYEQVKNLPEEAQEKLLLYVAKQPFYNTSAMDLRAQGTTQILDNLESIDVRDRQPQTERQDFIPEAV